MAERSLPDQVSARAHCEAGYIDVADYLAMCREYGWQPDMRLNVPKADHTKFVHKN